MLMIGQNLGKDEKVLCVLGRPRADLGRKKRYSSSVISLH